MTVVVIKDVPADVIAPAIVAISSSTPSTRASSAETDAMAPVTASCAAAISASCASIDASISVPQVCPSAGSIFRAAPPAV